MDVGTGVRARGAALIAMLVAAHASVLLLDAAGHEKLLGAPRIARLDGADAAASFLESVGWAGCALAAFAMARAGPTPLRASRLVVAAFFALIALDAACRVRELFDVPLEVGSVSVSGWVAPWLVASAACLAAFAVLWPTISLRSRRELTVAGVLLVLCGIVVDILAPVVTVMDGVGAEILLIAEETGELLAMIYAFSASARDWIAQFRTGLLTAAGPPREL